MSSQRPWFGGEPDFCVYYDIDCPQTNVPGQDSFSHWNIRLRSEIRRHMNIRTATPISWTKHAGRPEKPSYVGDFLSFLYSGCFFNRMVMLRPDFEVSGVRTNSDRGIRNLPKRSQFRFPSTSDRRPSLATFPLRDARADALFPY
jgi:hypothetical protein